MRVYFQMLQKNQYLMPAEIIATIYQALGISPISELYDATHRPYTLVPWGDSLDRLFA